MHIRVNIPAWGAREIVAGARALGRFHPARTERDLLALEIERVMPGWTATPLSSGRYAISVALMMLGLGGKRVAVPAYVCPAVLAGVRAAQSIAVPIDCQPDSLLFDRGSLGDAVAAGSLDGVIATNTYGVDQDLEWLGSLGLPIVEDAAYQTGRIASDAQPFGTRGNAGVLSFNFKALASVGGGILLTRGSVDGFVEESTGRDGGERRFVNYALRAIARHRIPSFLPGAKAPGSSDRTPRHDLESLTRGRMSELQAAIALVQWRSRDQLEAVQRRNVASLVEVIRDAHGIDMLDWRTGAITHLLPFVAASAEIAQGIRALLHEKGIQTEHPYPVVWDEPSAFPNALEIAERLVLVPCNASLGAAQSARVANALRSAVDRVNSRRAAASAEVVLR